MNKLSRSLLADFSLFFVGVTWGLTFVLIKFAIGVIPPMQFIAIRFIIAATILGLIFLPHLKKTRRDELLAGCIIGIFLYIGYLTQTIGLQFTTPGKSGFITSLYVVIVPFMVSFIRKKFVGWLPMTGSIIAVTGLSILSLSFNERFWLNWGDFLTIICAFSFAAQILAIERYTQEHNVYVLSVTQIAFTGIMSLIYSVLFEPVNLVIPAAVWGAIIYTGIVSTSGAFLLQNIAQKYTSSTHAALLLSLEAPFALLFSILFRSESITTRGIVGSSLIFLAILLIELGPVVLAKLSPNRHESGAANENT